MTDSPAQLCARAVWDAYRLSSSAYELLAPQARYALRGELADAALGARRLRELTRMALELAYELRDTSGEPELPADGEDFHPRTAVQQLTLAAQRLEDAQRHVEAVTGELAAGYVARSLPLLLAAASGLSGHLALDAAKVETLAEPALA